MGKDRAVTHPLSWPSEKGKRLRSGEHNRFLIGCHLCRYSRGATHRPELPDLVEAPSHLDRFRSRREQEAFGHPWLGKFRWCFGPSLRATRTLVSLTRSESGS